MPLLELLIVETVASGTMAIGLRKFDERAKIKASLMDWKTDATPTPFVDGILEKMAGTPETFKERKASGLIVRLVRDVVNRKAFQFFVEGCVNHNSKLREKLPFLQKLATGRSKSW